MFTLQWQVKNDFCFFTSKLPTRQWNVKIHIWWGSDVSLFGAFYFSCLCYIGSACIHPNWLNSVYKPIHWLWLWSSLHLYIKHYTCTYTINTVFNTTTLLHQSYISITKLFKATLSVLNNSNVILLASLTNKIYFACWHPYGLVLLSPIWLLFLNRVLPNLRHRRGWGSNYYVLVAP